MNNLIKLINLSVFLLVCNYFIFRIQASTSSSIHYTKQHMNYDKKDHKQNHYRSNILTFNKYKNKILLRGGSFDNEIVHEIPTTMISNSPPLALNCAHWMSALDCLESLQVSEINGLSTLDVEDRLKKYGKNALPEPPTKSILQLIIEQFDDKLVQILLSVAVLSGVLAYFEQDMHALAEPFIIISILMINSFVGISQSKSAEDSLDFLKKLQPETTCVLRDGIWNASLATSSIVPGDIIYLRVGDKVPADARIIHLKTNTFSTDEGCLTGESATVFKTTESVDAATPISGKVNMVFSGTVVTNGACYAVVTGTGAATEIGLINAGVQAAKEDTAKTPLAKKLDEFGSQLTIIIGLICGSVWLASIPKFNNPIFGSRLKGALYYAKIAVALGVAAIPEGLPAVITLCLALGTRRMAKKNVIVRKLSSVETLGCTSVVCTDKTGTLTTNKMTVKAIVTANSIINSNDNDMELKERFVEGVSYDPIGSISDYTIDQMKSPMIKMLSLICSLCNDAQIEFKDGIYDRIGEPTEAALKVLVEKLGLPDIPRTSDPISMANHFNNYWSSNYKVLSMLEFNRDRKSMSVLVKQQSQNKGDNDNYLLVKGASEMVISRCNRLQLDDGSIIPLTDDMKNEWIMKSKELATRPLRCLAMAYKVGNELNELNNINSSDEANQLPILKDSSNYINIENDMILVGICAIKDPARPEAAEAILKCRKAGIRVMMITGDSKETAIAIAKDVNIFDNNEDTSISAFTGREFFTSYTPMEQLELLRYGNKVFCRTEPMDKQKLITMLEQLNEITAMTGDGVNDAPALQQANIGIAMGITGTEVAKGAADMILADDNFSTIVNAVEEGRNIYTNMQTFISFLISCNIGEVVSIFLATILGIPEPLTPLQLLWVNLVTDGPPATALGFNPSDPHAMEKQPRPRNESILSKWLMTRYIITGLYVGFATIGIFVWWYLDKGVSFYHLRNWGHCLDWPEFAHSAEAPLWPKYPCDIFSSKMRAYPQSLSLSVLVMIEMFKALSAVSLDNSLLKVQPWANPWLLLGVTIPILLQLLVLYFPPLSAIFGLAPISLKDWKMVMKFSLPILLIEEVLKYIGRHLNELKSIASMKLKQAKAMHDRQIIPPPMF